MKVNRSFSLSIEAVKKLKQMAIDQDKKMSNIIEDFILSSN